MRRSLFAFALALCALLCAVPLGAALEATESVEQEYIPKPSVTASSWLVYDASDDFVVGAVQADTRVPIASVAKLMTALLVVEEGDLDALVEIPSSVNDLDADASRMDARPGEKWPMKELLDAMLVTSANDAAMALANHIGGSEAEFVAMMNERAEQIPLENTRFTSSSGLDLGEAVSESTATDLVELTKLVLKSEQIRTIVAMPELSLQRPGSNDDSEPLVFKNRNPLIGKYKGVTGVKTGFTDAAGYMLITHHLDAETNGELIIVTAQSSSEDARIKDVTALLDWALPQRTEVLLAEGGEKVGELPVDGVRKKIEVFVCDDVSSFVRPGQIVESKVVLPSYVIPPISAGTEVGELRIRVAGAEEIKAPLCSVTAVKKPTWRERSVHAIHEYENAMRAGTSGVKKAWSKTINQLG